MQQVCAYMFASKVGRQPQPSNCAFQALYFILIVFKLLKNVGYFYTNIILIFKCVYNVNFAETPTKCPNNSRMSPTLSAGGSQDSGGGVGSGGDRQLVVFASEKQARVVALPSHNCIYKQQLADTDFIIRAEIITLKGKIKPIDKLI